jgi:N-acetylglucosamine-6-phosphate deacetylase
MATTTPARAVGLGGAGELAPGGRADLVVLDERLHVAGVMRDGRWLVEP